jgi:predicted nucleic acid-binding protein
MIRVVIDTNVLVSALFNDHGAEAIVLYMIAAGQLCWCLSLPRSQRVRRGSHTTKVSLSTGPRR